MKEGRDRASQTVKEQGGGGDEESGGSDTAKHKKEFVNRKKS